MKEAALINNAIKNWRTKELKELLDNSNLSHIEYMRSMYVAALFSTESFHILYFHPKYDPFVSETGDELGNFVYYFLSYNRSKTNDVIYVKEIIDDVLKHKNFDPSKENNVILAWAVDNKFEDIVHKLLRDKRVLKDSKSINEIFINSTMFEYMEYIVEDLLNCPVVDPSYKNGQALIAAVTNSKISTVKLLLRDKRSVVPEQALFNAIYSGKEEIALLLLKDSRLKITTERIMFNALSNSLVGDQYDVFKLLLKRDDIDPSVRNNELLKSAWYNDQYLYVDKLINHKKVLQNLSVSFINDAPKELLRMLVFKLKLNTYQELKEYATIL